MIKDEWVKSSRSNGSGGNNCVQVMVLADGEQEWLMRDSKLGEQSPVLRFTRAEWEAFIAGVRAGEFNFA